MRISHFELLVVFNNSISYIANNFVAIGSSYIIVERPRLLPGFKGELSYSISS